MSVSVSVDVSGAQDFAQALTSFDSAMRAHVQQQLVNWAENVKIEAQKQVPVRTGYLQSTIFVNSHEWQVEVGAKAEYAAAVEFGTTHSRAKPYLTPAIEAYKPNLDQILVEAINQAKSEVQL